LPESKGKLRWRIVPNAITVGNMFCGFFAIIKIVQEDFVSACWLILLSAFLDAIDGKVARFTRVSSKFGVEFDSFSDIVSFGVAPSLLVFEIYLKELDTIGLFLSFLIVFAGATRLARYNIQTSATKHKGYFYGLPIPVAAVTIISYILFSYQLWGGLTDKKYLILMVILLSILMVTSIKYNPFPTLSFKIELKNILKIIVLVGLGVSIFYFKAIVLFPISVLAVLSGPFRKIFRIFIKEEEIGEFELSE